MADDAALVDRGVADDVPERLLVDAALPVEAVRPARLARGRHRRPSPVARAQVVAADGDHLLVVALHQRGVQLGRLAPVEKPARRPAAVLAVLREEALLPEGVELVHADALRVDLGSLLETLGPRRRLVANLPYAISGPFLRRLLDLREWLVDWSVMLQRDVAERLLAGPGSRDYTSLSVLHQLCVEVERTWELGPECFHPAPRVRSSFLRMRPLETAPDNAELARVERVTRAAFGARRKTLANALRAGGIADFAPALRAVGVEPGVRAERLAPARFVAIARALETPPPSAAGAQEGTS